MHLFLPFKFVKNNFSPPRKVFDANLSSIYFFSCIVLSIYSQIKQSLSLDNDGLISYMAVRAIGNSKNEVNLAMKSPAKTSYKSITDEL